MSVREVGMAGINGAIKLVAGNSNPRLAEAIAAYLKTPLAKAVVRRFADMEIFVEIVDNVGAWVRAIPPVPLPPDPGPVDPVDDLARRVADQGQRLAALEAWRAEVERQ